MTETCTFCPGEQWTYLYATHDPTQNSKELPVCVDCYTVYSKHETSDGSENADESDGGGA